MARCKIPSTLALAAALAACGHAEKPKQVATTSAQVQPAANVVVITTRDYAFDAPDSIPAGLTTLHLVNAGRQLHHVQLLELDAPHTAADFLKAVKASKPDAPLPDWVHPAGGVNAPRPGGEASATLPLTPGHYVMVCFIPDAKGVPHLMYGMARPLTVTAATGPAAMPPKPDVTLTLADYSFSLSTPLTAGTHTLEITNAGPQPHEVELVRLAPGKTAADVAMWVFKQQGPPPGEPLGGVPTMAVGSHAFITQSFTPGNYALLCFVPDAKDGKPHAEHGMVKQITVS